jgi:hypothetical protein
VEGPGRELFVDNNSTDYVELTAGDMLRGGRSRRLRVLSLYATVHVT